MVGGKEKEKEKRREGEERKHDVREPQGERVQPLNDSALFKHTLPIALSSFRKP